MKYMVFGLSEKYLINYFYVFVKGISLEYWILCVFDLFFECFLEIFGRFWCLEVWGFGVLLYLVSCFVICFGFDV